MTTTAMPCFTALRPYGCYQNHE